MSQRSFPVRSVLARSGPAQAGGLAPVRFLAASVLACLVLLGGASRADDVGATVYQKVLKSVVWIHSSRGGGKVATGSGSLLDRKHRLVLTNFHVVGDNDRATVMFPIYQKGKLVAEREFYIDRIRRDGIRGKVVARDRRCDLALIQLEDLPEGVEPLPLSPKSVTPGQSVQSIGNPGGSGALWVYTPGRVRQVYFKKWKSELDGRVANFEAEIVETDSATNPGDSGGPLVNDQAQLVGVTQGGAVNARLLSTFIDVSEVKLFLASRDVRKVLGNETLVQPRQPADRIKDEAKMFSPEAVKKATEELLEIWNKFHHDVVVETYPSVPAKDADKVREMNREERNKYFQNWASERLRSGAINGALILICEQPRNLQVRFSERVRSTFNDEDAQKIYKLLAAKFRDKEFDAGLQEAIRYIRDKFAERRSSPAAEW